MRKFIVFLAIIFIATLAHGQGFISYDCLQDLSDVGDGTPTNGNILIGDGTDWETQGVSGDATISNAGVVTVTGGDVDTAGALAADPADCSAGSFPIGINASGVAQSCTDAWTEAENTAAGYIANVVEDTTPELGGNLGAGGNDIDNLGNITFQTGATGGTIRTGTSNADKYVVQAYDVDGAAYTTILQADAGNDPQLQLFTDYLFFENSADSTKQMDIDLSGATTSTKTTFAISQTANRTLTMPDETGTICSSGSVCSGYQGVLTNSAGLRGALSDESGTGVAIFAGGNIGAGTATTAAADTNTTAIATTAFVQQEINGAGGTGLTCSGGQCNVDLGTDIDLSSEVTGELSSSDINWQGLEEIQAGDINWTSLNDAIQSTGINWQSLEDDVIKDDAINWQDFPHQISFSLSSPNDLTNKTTIGMIQNQKRDLVIKEITALADAESSLELFRVGGTASSINWDDLEVIEPFDINTANGDWYEAYINTGINWDDYELNDRIGINWQSGDPGQATINLKMWGK
jgi:hypothetical protein